MNNDLISREALKKEIAEFHQKEKERLHNSLWESIGLNALNKLIDNAPTISPYKAIHDELHKGEEE